MTAYRYNHNQYLVDFTGGQRDMTKNAEYKRFSEEYFTGQDVRIYFGDTWVDEVVALQFTMMQNVAPIFGYASYTYDAVAKGSRQIQGSFRINFKESYYLHFIMNRLESKLEGIDDESSNKFGVIPDFATHAQALNLVTPDKLIEKFATGQEFEQLATEFERSLWSSADDKQFNTQTLNREYDTFHDQQDKRPYMSKHGFNILILYGPYTRAYQNHTGFSSENQGEKVAKTAHTLTGVHITGVSQVVDGSGQPIYEEYSFIAKDLDGDINTFRTDPRHGV